MNMNKIDDPRFMAQLDFVWKQIQLNRMNLDDAERKTVAEFHQEWEQKAYGSNNYVRYGFDENGRAVLYRSTRNVAANAPAPDVPTNPSNWAKL